MKTSSIARSSSWLPEGFVELERVEDQVLVDGLILGRAGLCVQASGGEPVTGSAASRTGPPVSRARFEVLERLATLEAIGGRRASYPLRDRMRRAIGVTPRSVVFPESGAPDVWQFARSNGIALFDDWAAACDRAWWELCERDRVLRAWYGDGRPVRMAIEPASTSLPTGASYDWEIARFVDDGERASNIEVVGVFGLPRVGSAPAVAGYAARPSLDGALEAAVSEALQQLAFLWGEEIPTRQPDCLPTPLHHVEGLLWPGSHQGIRAWLVNGHTRFRPATPRPVLRAPDGFVDLTPPWLAGRACVARALARDAVPLVFGVGPLSAELPSELRMHPIG